MIYQKKYVQFVTYRLHGERNGRETGAVSNIALKNVKGWLEQMRDVKH